MNPIYNYVTNTVVNTMCKEWRGTKQVEVSSGVHDLDIHFFILYSNTVVIGY